MPNVGLIRNHRFNDARDRIMDRAEKAGFDYHVVVTKAYSRETDEDEYQFDLLLGFPKQSQAPYQRTVRISEYHADDFEKLAFETFEGVGQYRAIYFPLEKTVEALLALPSSQAESYEDLFFLPGVVFSPTEGNEFYDSGDIYTSIDDIPVPDDVHVLKVIGDYRKPITWRLPIKDCPSPLEVELSPLSRTFENFVGANHLPNAAGRISIKIRNVSDPTNVISVLESVSSSIFFEIDLRFDWTFSLVRQGRTFGVNLAVQDLGLEQDVVSYPRTNYAKSATTLYFYGKTAESAPLLRYLAYYQAIEHFFPAFVARDVIRRVRAELGDPRFNRRSDSDLQRLIRVATLGSLASTGEPEQVLRTLEGSLNEDALREALETDQARVEFLSLHPRNGGLEGIDGINFKEGKTSLIAQVANRIYKVRCRVVHTKNEWKEGSAPPILPFSEDAERLEHDLFLIQYVCQKVIIAGSD